MQYWLYLNNPFDTATKTSYRKALEISTMHNSSLQHISATQPLLVDAFNRYNPLHIAFANAYANWQAAGGTQSGQTLTLNQQMALAYAKVDDWDLNIQLKHRKNTDVYKSVLPAGRKPFYTGTADDKINAYNTFAIALQKHATLQDIATQVAATYNALNDARMLQQGTIAGTSNSGSALEAARNAALKMMHRNLGFCIDNFIDNPQFIETLFDIENIRNKTQNHFTGNLKLNDTKEVLIHTFLADDKIYIKSNGNGNLIAYLASTANSTDSMPINIDANTEKQITIADFAVTDLGTNRHLIIKNNGPEATQFVVDLE